MQARDTFDYEIVRIFYSSEPPFHLARSPYYRTTFSYAANVDKKKKIYILLI